jgi:hypothetical protein
MTGMKVQKSEEKYEKWDSLVFGLENGISCTGPGIYKQQENLKW